MLSLDKVFRSPSKIFWIHLVCILIVSLTPFLWLQDGSSIIGHDTGYAILPVEHFIDRLSTWTHRYGLGADQTFAVPGFFIHGFEALAYILAGSNHSLSQRLVFSTYMFGMGISMYLVARSLFPEYKDKLLPLFAGLFYAVNHFVLQAWFIAERPKFLTYIAFPLFILILYKLSHKKIASWKAGILTSVMFLFLNGGGAIPLFGALIVGGLLFSVIALFLSRSFFKDVISFCSYTVITLFSSLLLQAYWLLPYIEYLRASFTSQVAKSGGIDGVLSWVASISQDTSYSNLFRLQGIQEWYVNPFHTYAHYYFSSPILIAGSFVFPLLFLYALLQHEKRDRILVSTLSLTALVGMLFMAGTHAPFGQFYAFLLRNVPGFIAFRTPFYKFAPLLWFSSSLLTGYALTLMRDRFVSAKLQNVFYCVCVVLLLAYHFPFFSPRFFSYGASRTTNVQIPDYVFSYGRWMNSDGEKFHRTLVYPPVSQTTYVDERDWGYWSLSTVFSLVDRHSYAEATAMHTQAENQLIANVISMLEKNDPTWTESARFIGVDSIVLVKDRLTSGEQKRVADATFRYVEESTQLSKVQVFGKWEFYKITQSQADTVDSLHAVASFHSDSYADLSHVLSALPDKFDGFVDADIKIENSKAFVVKPRCEQCLLELPLAIQPPSVLLDAPGMPFYHSRKVSMDRERHVQKTPSQIVIFELENAVRYLSYIRFISNAHSPTPIRILAWRDYYAVLNELQTAVEKYIQTTYDLEQRNELLQTVQSTISLQWDELLTYMRVINDLDESGSYQQVLLSLSKIDANTKNAGYFSTEVGEKKYVIPSHAGSTYEIKLNPATTAAFSDTTTASVSAVLDEKQVYAGKISKDASWYTLAVVDVQPQKALKFLLRDQFILPVTIGTGAQRKIEEKIYTSLSLSDESGCAQVNLGKLLPGKYEVSFIANSPDRSIDIDSFALTKSETKPLLPFWGEHIKLVEGVDAKTTLQFVSLGEEDQFVRVCNLYAVRKPTILVRDLSIQRISSPEIVFTAKNKEYKESADRIVTVRAQTQTHYDIEVGAGKGGVLTLYQQFHPGWKISDTSLSHIQVNGFANGWVLPDSTTTRHYTVEFESQRKIELGAKVSIVSAITIVLSGAYVLIKRRTDHT